MSEDIQWAQDFSSALELARKDSKLVMLSFFNPN